MANAELAGATAAALAPFVNLTQVRVGITRKHSSKLIRVDDENKFDKLNCTSDNDEFVYIELLISFV
jgi:hypothetical protein